MMTRDHERTITTTLIRYLLAHGYAIRVYDGEAMTTPSPLHTHAGVMAELGSTDMDRLHLYLDGTPRGSVLLIYGNGRDVISDYSDSLSPVMDPFIDLHCVD